MTKHIHLLFISFFVGTLLSCNFEMPEKLSVKTNAKYDFSLGELKYDMGSLSSKLGSVNTSDAMTIYDYQPNKDDMTQQLAVEIPVVDYEVDISEYLKKADFNGQVNGVEQSYEIPVPSFNLPGIDPVTVPLQTINDSINQLVIVTATPLSSEVIIVKDDNNYFNDITYKSGKFEIYVCKAENIDITNINATQNFSDYCEKSLSGKTISIGGKTVELTRGFGSFDLSGYVIDCNSPMSIDAKSLIEVDPLNPFNIPSYIIVGKVSSDSKIKKITGLTLNSITIDEIPLSKMTVPAGNSSSVLKECEIGDSDTKKSKLEVSTNIPASWVNFALGYELKISGGLKKQGSTIVINSSSPTYLLNGVTFTNSDIEIEPSIKNLAFNNTTIDFDESPAVSVTLNIEKINSVTVAMESNVNTKIQVSQALDDQILKFLKEVKWAEAGLNITYSNGLPAGNDIKISIDTDLMGIHETDTTIKANVDNEKLKLNSVGTVVRFGKVPSVDADGIKTVNSIDISADFKLPGYKEVNGEKTFTLKNIVMGSTYTFSIKAEPIVEWEYIKIDSSALDIPSQQMGVPLDIQKMLSSVPGIDLKKVNFGKMPMYLYCDFGGLDSMFKESSITASVSGYVAKIEDTTDGNGNKVQSVTKATGNTIYLVGDKNGSKAPLPAKSAPVIEKTTTEEDQLQIITDDLEKTEASVKVENINELLNELKNQDSGNGLGIDFSVGFQSSNQETTLKITKADIDSSDGKSSVSITAFIVIPFTFEIVEDLVIKSEDILKDQFKKNSDGTDFDLLQRKNANDLEEYKKYTDILESACISFDIKKLPINLENSNLQIEVDLEGRGEDSLVKPVVLNQEHGEIPLNPSELVSAGTYPMQPTFNITLSKGKMSIERNIELGALIKVSIKASGAPIEIWNNNTSENGKN